MIAEAQQVADDMFRYPFQLAFAAAFGEEGYGLPAGGTAPHPAGHHRRRHRGPGTCARCVGVRPVVIAVGDVDPDEASALLAGAFGGGRARAPVDGLPALDWVAGAGGETPARVVSRDKAQAAIAMAFPGVPRRHRDRAAAQVWAAVASGLGGRLFEALRDRRSLAYTVVASAWLKARAGALVTYIATSPEREDEAREEMLRELERFTREPVSGSGAAAGGELPGRPGGSEPPVRRRGGERDPRGVGVRIRARGAGGSRRRRSGPSPPRTCCGWRRRRSIPSGGSRGWSAGTGRPVRRSRRCSPSGPAVPRLWRARG